MGNQVDKKFTWVIKDFCSLRSKIIYSEEFVIDGCKWRLMAYPFGDRKRNKGNMSLYLDVADSQYLPCGWRRHARFHLTVVNQLSEKLSREKVKNKWFDQKTPASGFVSIVPRHELLIKESGFLVDGEVKIVVRIEVFQVIGKANSIVLVKSEEECKEEASRPLHSGSRLSKGKKKYTWVIKDYSSLQSEDIIFSDKFVIGGCKWRLMCYPRGDRKSSFMSLYLDVADPQSLPCGWRRHAKFTLKVVNQLSRKDSRELGKNNVFDQKTLASGFVTMIRRCDIDYLQGFLVNGEVKIVVEVDLLEFIGKVDVPEESDKESEEEDESEKESEEEDESEKESESEDESEETGRPLKKMKLNNNDGAVSSDDDIHNETQQGRETVSVHGFHVLPSQVELVSRIFKKYPDIALEYRAKNQHLRTACVNVLLSLIKTLCQSPQELSNEDLVESDNALSYVKDAGFKIDWLEKKLAEVKERKEEEQTGEARIQEFEEELKDSKQKCLDLEALLEKEKAKVLAARASLTLDDFV